MGILILASGVGFIGAIIGWFSRGLLVRALVLSAAASLGCLAAVLFYGGEPQSIELCYLATLPIYWIGPYVLFFLIPCVVAAWLTIFIYRRSLNQ